MDDLLLAGGADAVDVDGPALHEVAAVGGFALVEQVVVLGQFLHHGEAGDDPEVLRRQAGEKLAAAQGADEPGELEVGGAGWHGHNRPIDTAACEGVAPKIPAPDRSEE